MNFVFTFKEKKFEQILTKWSVAKLLLCLYLLFLFYVTYKPFNFNPTYSVFVEQIEHFLHTILALKETILATKSDVIANIIVFIPFGSLIYWYKWEKKNFQNAIKWKEVLIWVLGTTVLIEFGQLFLLSRHPSITDIITNTIGGMVGFFIANHLINNYNKFIRFINHLIQEKWDVKLFIFLILLMFAYAWFTFSFGISLWQVKYHLRFLFYSPVEIPNLFNAIPYMVLYFYLQMLALEIVEKYFNFNKILIKIFIAFLLVTVVSFLQFLGQSFVNGRTYNFEDLCMAFSGILFGIVFAYNLYVKGQLIFDKNNVYLLIILRVTLFLNILFILGASLFPFYWNFDVKVILSKFIIALVPFNNYVNSNKLYLLIDLAKDIFKFVPLTLIISAIYDVKGKMFQVNSYVYLFLAVLFLEFLQVFNKNFNPDISDIFLGIFSLYLGRRIWVLGKIALKVND